MKFTHRFTINAPLTAVTQFHHDSHALRLLTPPPLWVQFHRVEPLAEGSVADFTMWFGPLPVRWTAVHSRVTPQGFVDTQQRGPFQAWQHQHHFQDLGDGRTAVMDTIEAQPRSLISHFMWLTLPILFAFRAWRTRHTLQSQR